MKGKSHNIAELKNRDIKKRVVGNTANSEISSISTRGGFEVKEKVSVVYEGSSDNLQAAYRLLAGFFKEYLSESDQKQKVGGGDVH